MGARDLWSVPRDQDGVEVRCPVCERAVVARQVGAVYWGEAPERDPMLFVNSFEPSWVNLCPICSNHEASTGGRREARGLGGQRIPGLSPSAYSVCSCG